MDLQQLTNSAQTYGVQYERMHNAAATLLNFVALEARAVMVTLGSSVLSADLARSAYVSLDAGIAYPWRLESMVFYAGTNIYFRPINKAAPLRYKGTFLHRFALTVGITTTVTGQEPSRGGPPCHHRGPGRQQFPCCSVPASGSHRACGRRWSPGLQGIATRIR